MMSSAVRSLACAHTVVPSPTGDLQVVGACIDIRDSHIVKVETTRSSDFPKKLAEWQKTRPHLSVYDRKMISPAFINPHTHLAMSFFRGIATDAASQGNMVEDLFFRVETELTSADVRAFTRMGAYECLLNGVGLVWDHYYHGMAVAQGMADTGLAGVVAPTLQDRSGPGKSTWQREWQDTEAIASSQTLRAQGIYAAFGPHASDTVSGELWQKIAAAAAKAQLPLHSHLAQSFEEYERISTEQGCSPLAYLERLGVLRESPHSLLVHNIFVDAADLQRLQPGRQTLAYCPFSALIFCFPAQVMDWHHAGVPFVVATDCVASNDSMNVQKELRYLAGFPLQQLSYHPHWQEFQRSAAPQALTAIAALRKSLWQDHACFRDPSWLLSKVWQTAGMMHPQVQAGTIAAGQLANLVVWDARHPSLWPGEHLRTLAFGDTAASIHQMIVAGRSLGEEGNFAGSLLASPAYLAAEQEASQRWRELLKRCQVR